MNCYDIQYVNDGEFKGMYKIYIPDLLLTVYKPNWESIKNERERLLKRSRFKAEKFMATHQRESRI